MKHVIFCNNNHTHQYAQLCKYDIAPDTQVQIHGVLMAAVQLLGPKEITWGSPNWACTPNTCHSLPNWVLSLRWTLLMQTLYSASASSWLGVEQEQLNQHIIIFN